MLSGASGIKKIVNKAESVEKIIVTPGSLKTKYEAANLGERLFWLVNSGGKKVRPLAIRNEPWGFGPINKIDLVVKKMKGKK